jgi:integrin alpha FG-GAP repeat containing protein 1
MLTRDPRLRLYADLVLICDDGDTGNKVFQIWINQKKSGFKLQQSGKLPAGTQSLSFADVGTYSRYHNTLGSEAQGLQTEMGLSI